MEFSRPEYQSGYFPSQGHLPNPRIEPRSPTLQADSVPAEPPGKPSVARNRLQIEHWFTLRADTRRHSLFSLNRDSNFSLILFMFANDGERTTVIDFRVPNIFLCKCSNVQVWALPGGSDSKELPYNVGDLGSIPGLGRSPGEGNGNPLQYSCLEDFMDRGAWWARVHGITKNQTWLSDFTFLFFLGCTHRRKRGVLGQRVRHNWGTNTFTVRELTSQRPPNN